ncbi:MAG TPA: hypothetical protein VFO31_03940 [Vicinamibacterales bacterium]|nr:hypothetical protein [Vicinamibacterales bacterium]
MRGIVWTAILAVWAGAVVQAQQPPAVVIPAGNVLLPNTNSVPIGPNAGLEGGAYVARVGDPSSAWLNPAGLSRAQAAEIAGSSGLFQISTLSPADTPGTGGSVVRLPSLVGFSVKNAFGGRMTFGLSIATVTSWSQDTDMELINAGGSTAQRFAFSADSTFDRFVGAAGGGYVKGRWRVGGGLALVQTNLETNAVTTTRAADTSLRSLLLESRVSGTAFHLRPVAGVQYDWSPRLRLGFMARTPAPTIYSAGSITAEGVAVNGGSSSGVSFFDPEATFRNKLPFELRGGVAYIGRRIEIETDVAVETPVSAYNMLESGETIVAYSAGAGSPVITTRPFSGLVSQSRAVVNVAVGGHVVLTDSGVWRLHFGAGTDRSSVGPEDEVFTKIHFGTWTLGISGTRDRLQFTAGLNYRSGSSEDLVLGQLDIGTLVRSGMDVRTVGIIYAFSYRF